MKNTRIYNGTPHVINIISDDSVRFEPKIRKYITEEPEILHTVEPQGMLSAKYDNIDTGSENGIPVRDKILRSYDPLPDGYDIYITSALYATAVDDDDREKVYTIIDPVFDITGTKILGCLAIGRVL